MIEEAPIRLRWDAVGARLDERGRRLFAAAEVRAVGRGGLAVVSKITGLARSTINRGKKDLDAQPLAKGRVRRAGGGRRSVCDNDPGLVPALERLVEPATLGDPMRPLIWESKSMEKLAATLTEMGHPISVSIRTSPAAAPKPAGAPAEPVDRTSAAAKKRRPRSSSCAPTASHRNRIGASSIMPPSYPGSPKTGIPNS